MNNLIPPELRGKTVVPLLEYLRNLSKKDLRMIADYDSDPDIKDLIDFYSQPFSVEMLCNMVNYNVVTEPNTSNINQRYKKEWQQAEEKVLFEGCYFEDRNKLIRNKNGLYLRFYEENDYLYLRNNDYSSNMIEFAHLKNLTLNDFITLCTLAGVKLTFKN